MRAARLDRRVRTEAEALVRDARAALSHSRQLRGKAGELELAANEVAAGLAAKDLMRVRRGLPRLDLLVDDLVKAPANKSVARDYIESIGSAVLIAFALRAMVLAAFEIPSSSMYPTVEINDHIFVNKLIYGLQIPFTGTKLFQWRKPQRGEVIVFLQPCTTDRDYIKRVVATEGQSVEVRCNIVYVDGQAVPSTLVPGDCNYEDKRDIGDPWSSRPCSEYVERVGDREYHTFHDPDRPRRDRVRAKTGTLPSANSHDFPPIDGSPQPPSCSRQADGERFESPNQLPGEIVQTKQDAGVCDLQMHYVVPKGHVFAMGDNRSNSTDSRSWGSVPIENIHGKALFIWLSYRDWTLFRWGLRWNRMGAFVE